ncbi:MAG: DUF1990 domain-containing protein [Saprospiraceae bacterium]|nr:DUF1990 domain-containing protein [Saprospiraceae bacterium]
MWISFHKPTRAEIDEFLHHQKSLPFSYQFVGKTSEDFIAPGFDNDYNVVELGAGAAVWEKSKQAIAQWKMFPGVWAYIEPANAPICENQVVAMVANIFGIWWLNSCRIVYTIDNEHQFGFAYGTLPGHVECGEELFMVEKDGEGNVRYVLKAFSRPRFWLARLAYPAARFFQKRFVRQSKAAMFKMANK